MPGALGAFAGASAFGAPGIAGMSGNSAPHSGQIVSVGFAEAPHWAHVLLSSMAAGLKHMVVPFFLF